MKTRARFGVLGTVLLLLCFTLGAPGVSASGKGTTTTTVAGAWQATPALVPTGGAPPDCDFTSVAFATLNGAFVGAWHETSMRAVCDYSNLPNSVTYRNSGTGTFEGIYFPDQSPVSFTWKGAWTGDAISGQAIGVFDVKSSEGCTFRLTFDGYASFHTSFGGYNGKWIRGCRS